MGAVGEGRWLLCEMQTMGVGWAVSKGDIGPLISLVTRGRSMGQVASQEWLCGSPSAPNVLKPP